MFGEIGIGPGRPFYGGTDYIAGVIRINGVPSLARLWVLDQETGRIFINTWTNPDGTFYLRSIDPTRKYVAIGFDPITGEKAEVFDRI